VNRYFDNVILEKPFTFFVLILAVMNTIFIMLYFSGNAFLQSIMVPSIPSLEKNSWREFGIMEMLQNVLLLILISLLVYGMVKARSWIDRILYCLAILVFTFLFLEEIDYGYHYYEIITGDLIQDQPRNWHNQQAADGHQNTRKVKRLADAMTLFVFVLLPLLCLIKPIKEWIGTRNFVPTIHFVGVVFLAIVFSKIAHGLDDAGFGMVNGIEGELHNNISEFRETSTYYVYILYVLKLISRDSLFSRQN